MSFIDLSLFRDDAVRDLAWLLTSPDLLSAVKAGAPLATPVDPAQREDVVRWLHALDREPAGLHDRVSRVGSRRLGFYAEALLDYFLAQGPFNRLIAANVPLRAAGQTLGEVDFLLENARGERLHWELAVKFYLHIDGNEVASLRDFVGPNLQDRLDLKHARLLSHQLRLSARDEFASLGFDGPFRAELFVKGRLFYRHGEEQDSPPELADNPLRGGWTTASEWQGNCRPDESCHVLPRLAWLAPRHVLPAGPPFDLVDETLTQPVMVAYHDRSTGTERSRGFIVPDDWPERAARFTTT